MQQEFRGVRPSLDLMFLLNHYWRTLNSNEIDFFCLRKSKLINLHAQFARFGTVLNSKLFPTSDVFRIKSTKMARSIDKPISQLLSIIALSIDYVKPIGLRQPGRTMGTVVCY